MELEYKDEYPEEVSRGVYSHTITIGVIMSILLSIASLIVIVLVFHITSLIELFMYMALIVLAPMLIISYIAARRLSKTAYKEARRFVEVVVKLSNKIGTDKVELLENPPPPYIALMKHGKYYIAMNHYGYRGVYVTVFEPFDTSYVKGYVSVYLKKKRELITCEYIDNHKICIYKLLAVFPVPLEDKLIEGIFYTYEFYLTKLDADKIYEVLDKLFKEIKRLRELYPGETSSE